MCRAMERLSHPPDYTRVLRACSSPPCAAGKQLPASGATQAVFQTDKFWSRLLPEANGNWQTAEVLVLILVVGPAATGISAGSQPWTKRTLACTGPGLSPLLFAVF